MPTVDVNVISDPNVDTKYTPGMSVSSQRRPAGSWESEAISKRCIWNQVKRRLSRCRISLVRARCSGVVVIVVCRLAVVEIHPTDEQTLLDFDSQR